MKLKKIRNFFCVTIFSMQLIMADGELSPQAAAAAEAAGRAIAIMILEVGSRVITPKNVGIAVGLGAATWAVPNVVWPSIQALPPIAIYSKLSKDSQNYYDRRTNFLSDLDAECKLEKQIDWKKPQLTEGHYNRLNDIPFAHWESVDEWSNSITSNLDYIKRKQANQKFSWGILSFLPFIHRFRLTLEKDNT